MTLVSPFPVTILSISEARAGVGAQGGVHFDFGQKAILPGLADAKSPQLVLLRI